VAMLELVDRLGSGLMTTEKEDFIVIYGNN